MNIQREHPPSSSRISRKRNEEPIQTAREQRAGRGRNSYDLAPLIISRSSKELTPRSPARVSYVTVRQRMKIAARRIPPPPLMLFYAATMFVMVAFISSVAIRGIAQGEVRIPDRTQARFAKKEDRPKIYWACIGFYSAASVFLGGMAVRWTSKALSDLAKSRPKKKRA